MINFYFGMQCSKKSTELELYKNKYRNLFTDLYLQINIQVNDKHNLDE